MTVISSVSHTRQGVVKGVATLPVGSSVGQAFDRKAVDAPSPLLAWRSWLRDSSFSRGYPYTDTMHRTSCGASSRLGNRVGLRCRPDSRRTPSALKDDDVNPRQ